MMTGFIRKLKCCQCLSKLYKLNYECCYMLRKYYSPNGKDANFRINNISLSSLVNCI